MLWIFFLNEQQNITDWLRLESREKLKKEIKKRIRLGKSSTHGINYIRCFRALCTVINFLKLYYI